MSECTLVLIPGLMCDAAVWQPQQQHLAGVAPIEIAEHGLAADLGEMAQQILAAYPGALALAGHSMGGRVALEVVRRAPQRVRGLALLDTGCHALAAGAVGERERDTRMGVLAQARREGLRAAAEAWLDGMIHPSRLKDQPLRESILEMWERRSLEHLAAQMQALLERPEAAQLLPGLAVPALVLCGAEDRSAPVQQHMEMAGLLPQSDYVQVADCGHMCTLERSAEVNSALAMWFSRIEAYREVSDPSGLSHRAAGRPDARGES
jgi:pimeloyl-ACP methyl ester carboxylesterase